MSRPLPLNPTFIPPPYGVLRSLLENPLKLPLHHEDGERCPAGCPAGGPPPGPAPPEHRKIKSDTVSTVSPSISHEVNKMCMKCERE